MEFKECRICLAYHLPTTPCNTSFFSLNEYVRGKSLVRWAILRKVYDNGVEQFEIVPFISLLINQKDKDKIFKQVYDDYIKNNARVVEW